MMTCGIYPPTPPENIDAVLTAMEKYERYWWQ
jgi:uroporphyrinogen-III decarboxylase